MLHASSKSNINNIGTIIHKHSEWLCTRGEVEGLGAWFLHELIDQSDVGKRPSGHDRVVTTTSSVRIELSRSQPEHKTIDLPHAVLAFNNFIIGNGNKNTDATLNYPWPSLKLSINYVYIYIYIYIYSSCS